MPDSIKKKKKRHTDCKSRNKAVVVCRWNDCLCRVSEIIDKKNPETNNNHIDFAGYQAKIQNAIFPINYQRTIGIWN